MFRGRHVAISRRVDLTMVYGKGVIMNWYFEVLKKYAVFSGRARRKEYWMFFLFNMIISFLLTFIDRKGSAMSLYSLALLVPAIAVGVRRMHDTDHSGWWILFPVVNLVFAVQEGQQGSNRFGADPKGMERVRVSTVPEAQPGSNRLPPDPAEDTMKRYHNRKWGLSLEYPAAWEIMWENEPDGGWEIVVGVTGMPSRSGRPVVTVRVLQNAVLNFSPAHVTEFAAGGPGAPMELPRTPEEYNEICRQELKGILPGLQFLSEKSGTIAGMSAGTLLYSYRSTTGSIRETQINLFGSDKTYRLLCEAPEEQSESVEKYFDSVVANFKPFAG
jgi:uncharacterized membrane protein YhaH (DUF805 family)